MLVNSAGKVEPGYVAKEAVDPTAARSGSPLLTPGLINLVSAVRGGPREPRAGSGCSAARCRLAPGSRATPASPRPNPAQGLFGLLKGNVKRQLKQLYPSAPERADAWLAAEIVRAATDPGSKGVFTSVFYLEPPRPLNYLVTDKFGGPVLVLQVLVTRGLSMGSCTVWVMGLAPLCCRTSRSRGRPRWAGSICTM